MKCVKIFFVFTLLGFQCNCENDFISTQHIYKYSGKVVSKNEPSENDASIWTVSGNLIIQDIAPDIIFKLENVKTRLFTGDLKDLEIRSIEVEIPDDSKSILEPFTLHPRTDDLGFNISYNPNEPIWSLNMKRAIGSIYYLNFKKDELSTETSKNIKKLERTIFGDCEVKFEAENKNNEKIYKKTILHKTCDKNFVLRNVKKAPTSKDYETFNIETQRVYHFKNSETISKIESKSTIKYKSMPGTKSVQVIEQNQEFVLKSSTKDFKPFDISKNTVLSQIIFDYSENIEGGRNAKEKNISQSDLVDNFINNYKEFKAEFDERPLQNVDSNFNDKITEMFDCLAAMENKTMKNLGKKIFTSDDKFLQQIFVSYLPNIGTNDSLKNIIDMVVDYDFVNSFLIVKMLATFTDYYTDFTEGNLQDLELLFDLETTPNHHVKQTAALSFATLVANANSRGILSETKVKKYINDYINKINRAEDYETKMIYLLGLINMAEVFTDSQKIEIINNPSESHHFRALAMHGFKESLLNDASNVYTNFWPVLQNVSEHLQIRVAALDILLDSAVTEEQFNKIKNWYNTAVLIPSEQNIANYYYTTLQSMQNSTGFLSPLSNLATESIKAIRQPKNLRSWATGNYRLAYTDTDSNVGTSMRARLISNPISNMPNVGIFSFENFALSLTLNNYKFYFKFEGYAEEIFSYSFINKNEELSVTKLVEILKKNLYKIKKNEEIHLELVIFSDNKAIFGAHFNRDFFINLNQKPFYLELESLLTSYTSLSFPLVDYNYLISDLGTGILLSNGITDVTSYDWENILTIFAPVDPSEKDLKYTLNYRNLWYYCLYIESYNPLAGESTDIYTYIGEETSLHIPLSLNTTDLTLKWKHSKDEINFIEDRIMGSGVNNLEKLQNYCPTCDKFTISPFVIENESRNAFDSYKYLTGFTFNITYSLGQIYESIYDVPLPYGIQDYQLILIFSSVTKPILMYLHSNAYTRYLTNDTFQYVWRSEPILEEPVESVLDLTLNKENKREISLSLMTLKSSDNKILQSTNITYYYVYNSNKTEEQTDLNQKLRIVMFTDKEIENKGKDIIKKVCIDREISFPRRRTDRYSLQSYEPTTGTIKFSTGFAPENSGEDVCPTDIRIKYTEIYSNLNDQEAYAQSTKEFINCKDQSHGLKYTPPTHDCIVAHDSVARYKQTNIYMDSRMNKNMPKMILSYHTTPYGMPVFNYKKINETVTESGIDKIYEEIVPELRTGYPLTKTIIPKLDVIPLNPEETIYNDYKNFYGFESVCHIMPSRVQTFTENIIKKYYEKTGEESLAFTECANVSTNGMTIQKYEKNHIGFTVWRKNNTITASVQDGKIKIQLNGNEINSEHLEENPKIKIDFIDNDVVHISTTLFDIFYNTEYISIKIASIYNKFICGLCAETQDQ